MCSYAQSRLLQGGALSDREEADAIRELEVSCSRTRLCFIAYLRLARFFFFFFFDSRHYFVYVPKRKRTLLRKITHQVLKRWCVLFCFRPFATASSWRVGTPEAISQRAQGRVGKMDICRVWIQHVA